MGPYTSLQDVLKEKSQSKCQGRLLLYSLGNTQTPLEITYAGLYEQSKQIGSRIRALDNFKAGHPVLLHFDDHWDTILWFWSVLFAGGLPVLSSPLSNIESDRQKHIQALSALLQSPICLTRLKFLALFGGSHDMHLHSIESLLDEAEPSPKRIKLNNGARRSSRLSARQEQERHSDGVDGYDRSQNGGDNARETETDTRAVLEDNNLLMLMLTSGSTGNAKAVQFTHSQVLAAISGKVSARQLPPNRPFLNWIGLDHVASLIEIHMQALWLGVDQVHVSAADVVPSPETFMDLLSRHRISRTFAPNFFLSKLVSAIESLEDSPAWDLSSLVCVNSGGEPNDVKTCQAASALFSRYGAPRDVIITGFGMTETCAGAIFNTNCPKYDVSQGYTVACLGKCMRGIEMRVVVPGVQGCAAAPNEAGELQVRGPVVFGGYYRNEVATGDAFTQDHWFRTGDQATIDSNGSLKLVGRAKDVININGVKIVTADIQTAIDQAVGDRVARVVVFPSVSSHTEQVTVAFVPKAFPAPDREIVDITRLATQACLVSTSTMPLVFALGEKSLSLLPISTLGKVSRIKMARLFEDGEFQSDLELHQDAMLRSSKAATQTTVNGNKTGSISKMEAGLIEDIAETLALPPDALGIHVETSLFDIGFTSMHVIKLKYHIEKRLGVDIPVILIMKNPSIRTLAESLEAQVRQSKQTTTEEESSVNVYDPVVVFRPNGSKTPLWLIHPGVGEVLVFVGLAQHLAADDRPVFALRAAGFEPGQQRFSSIEQAVDVYTSAIRRRQPQGPYALAGYSYGTMLAFEASKRLVSDGDEVRFLGSLNLPPHIKQRIRQLNWNVCLLHLAHFLELVTESVADALENNAKFRKASRSKALRMVMDKADKGRMTELGLETDAVARWADVAFGLQSMASDYEPSGQVDSIDVFHAIPLKAAASSREIWLEEHLGRWVDFAREQPRFHAVGGAHYTMIGPDHVGSFSKILVKALKERGL